MRFILRRFLGKDENGDVFIYDCPPHIIGKEPNRCVVSCGHEEKIYDTELEHFTDFGKILPIKREMFENLAPLEIKEIMLSSSITD